jgi:hypothetical protein
VRAAGSSDGCNRLIARPSWTFRVTSLERRGRRGSSRSPSGDVCSGSGDTRGGVLLEDRDERRRQAEGVGYHARLGLEADGGPDLSIDLGDHDSTSEGSLRVEGREPAQRDSVIGVGVPDGERESMVKRRGVACK